MNSKTGSAPIHTAALSNLNFEFMQLLLGDSRNKADVNAVNKDGFNAFHILLSQLIELATHHNKPIENRGAHPAKDEDLENSQISVIESLKMISKEKNCKLDYGKALVLKNEKNSTIKNKITLKKLCTMTPLQIICSFQTWNAKPITEKLHQKVAELVDVILSRGADPNGCGAKGAIPGSVPGSTPPVILAATRGYYHVIEVFKKIHTTDFMIENKFNQTILHIILKAGYYNKIVVHGEESGEVNTKSLNSLFNDNNLTLQAQMRSIVNKVDNGGNTPLHYAKPYPDQAVVKMLLCNGAKLDRNSQGAINLNPKTLEEHFYENCIETEGEDIDDEEFRIRIKYKLFEKPQSNKTKSGSNNQYSRESPEAWISDTKDLAKEGKSRISLLKTSGKVDTKRLEYFSDVDSLHYLLKHPVMTSFLEMELNSLRFRYALDFILYLIFVIVLFLFLSDRYTLSRTVKGGGRSLYIDESIDFEVTYSLCVLGVLLLIMLIRELWQIIKLKKRYFESAENYIEWTVIILVILNILPGTYINRSGSEHLQRHIAALTLLIAFMQLYLLLVRVVPNTPLPLYINMFTTVLKTYTLILLSYMAFIISFAYSFYLLFSPIQFQRAAGVTNNANSTDDEEDVGGDPYFQNFGLSFVKTLVMFVAEMDYTDLVFSHWLGYVIFVLFLFLVIIVLMNILNGLAVSDIHKIQEEVDTYYHISIVETLAYTSFVSLLAEEVVIYPNIKPERQKLLGLSVPGTKVNSEHFRDNHATSQSENFSPIET